MLRLRVLAIIQQQPVAYAIGSVGVTFEGTAVPVVRPQLGRPN
jgi:hypothetical protein